MAMRPRRIPAAPVSAMSRIGAAQAYLHQALQPDLPACRKLPGGTPAVPRWSWDGADRLLTAKIRP